MIARWLSGMREMREAPKDATPIVLFVNYGRGHISIGSHVRRPIGKGTGHYRYFRILDNAELMVQPTGWMPSKQTRQGHLL